ncbi:MAG: Propanoyl-CoA C-acyltransferase [Frankiales bacterium]|jgi:acetyl-CoA acyltransferase|nr:Propanoyl-CoA C-acyltransferase [Frankiales bacterium]
MVTDEAPCGSGGAALQLAVTAVATGAADVAVAVAAERLTSPDRARTFAAIGSAMDLEEDGSVGEEAAVQGRSGFVDVYARLAVDYLARTGAALEDLPWVVVKNRRYAAGNSDAQLRVPTTIEEVLAARLVRAPLTVPMCSPIGDGAAEMVSPTTRCAGCVMAPRPSADAARSTRVAD